MNPQDSIDPLAPPPMPQVQTARMAPPMQAPIASAAPTRRPQLPTGRWAYLCKRCSSIAFVFPGEGLPSTLVPLEDVQYTTRGKFRPRNPARPVCGQCGDLCQLDPGGVPKMNRVIEVDSFCKAKGIPVERYGYAPRNEQVQDGFFMRDSQGQIVPARGQTVLRMHLLPARLLSDHMASQQQRLGPAIKVGDAIEFQG